MPQRGSSSSGSVSACRAECEGSIPLSRSSNATDKALAYEPNLLVGGEIRYTTRGEGDRTVGREWLQKYMVLWGSGYPPTLSLWGHEFDSR